MIRHLPGEPVDGVQRCEWCKRSLVEWTTEEMRLETDPAGPFYFTPGVEILHEGAFMGTNRHQTTGEPIDPDAPTCIPNLEGVNIE